jgi:hypothetical protein
MDFDQERLRRALTEAKLGAEEKTLTIIANRLRVFEHRYRARIGERRQGPTKEELSAALEQIQEAATKILNVIGEDETMELETLLCAFSPYTPKAVATIVELRDTAQLLSQP